MNTSDVVKQGVEASPPVAYAALHLFGISMPDWVAILTLCYTVLSAAHLIWRWVRAARKNP